MGPSDSIRAVAAVQILGSLALLLLPGVVLTGEIRLRRWYPTTYQPQSAVFYAALVALPICLSLFGIITAIGLLRLREWARRVALYFPAVPVLACALWLLLHHPPPLSDSALLVVGDFSNVIAGCLLVILVPISLWWWILFTRKSVRSQFQGR